MESQAGVGSSFIFTAQFPLSDEQPDTQVHLSQDLEGMRVLVVDDNATSRMILREMLEPLSIKVDEAASGSKGLAMFKQQAGHAPYNLLFIDWQMPGMDGITTAGKIMQACQDKNPPKIILITAYAQEEARRAADKVGLDGLLIKPASPSSLFDGIMGAFGKKTSARRAARRTEDLGQMLAHIRGASLLLVEDNEINQQVAREILEGAGLTVTIANNGQEGVDAIKSANYQAVLMDVQMPVMDGYTAARTIRMDKNFDDLPIIAMTANAMAGDREKALKAGMNDHVAKPIEPKQLFSSLNQWIEPGKRGFVPQKGPLPSEAEQAGAAEELPASLPGFDLEEGLNRVGGNKKLYRSLLIKLRDEYASVHSEITGQLAAEQFEEAERAAHTIKGVAGNVGAGALQEAAGELEAAIRGRQKDLLPQKMAALQDCLAAAMDSLKELGPGDAETGAAGAQDQSGPAASSEELVCSLEAILPHLKSKKPKPVKEALALAAQLNWPTDCMLDFSKLGKLIKKYKFKEAVPLTQSLLDRLKE